MSFLGEFVLVPIIVVPWPQAPLTLDSAVETALRNHPRVAAARRDREAATLGLRSASAVSNPSLLLSPAIGSLNGTTEEFLLTQPLEINGSRTARRRLASAKSVEADRRLDGEIRAVVAEVQAAVVGLWRERSLLRLATATRDDLARIETLTRKQVELGSRAGVDSTRASLELLRAEQRVTLSRGRMLAAQTALAVAMGLDPGASIGELADPPAPGELPDLERSLAAARGSRWEIDVQAALLEAARADNRIVRADSLPDLAPQFRAQQLLTRRPSTRDYGFSVAIQWPVLDWGGRRTRLAQGNATIAAQQERLAATRRTVDQEVAAAHARLDAAKAVLASTGAASSTASRLLDSITVGYREGTITLPAFLDAQRSHRETIAETIEAQAEATLAWIHWEKVLGTRPLPAGGLK